MKVKNTGFIFITGFGMFYDNSKGDILALYGILTKKMKSLVNKEDLLLMFQHAYDDDKEDIFIVEEIK